MVVANLEGALDRAPAAHVYFEKRVPWVELGDHLPRLGGDGDRAAPGGGVSAEQRRQAP